MKLLVFDIIGKFGHFRKFYTNSSSLSYSVPPRTTIMGIIAAVMGYERDSYYSLLHSSRCGIALRKISINRRIMQTVNYIKADSPKLIYNPKNHTQIPLELLTSEEELRFRVYFTHEDEGILEELKERVYNKKFHYSPYLGSASFNCSLNYVAYEEGKVYETYEPMPISTVINLNKVKENSIDIFKDKLFLIRERMPRDIREGRIPERAEPYLLEDKGKQIRAAVKEEIIKVTYRFKEKESEDNIIFM
ncbi:type I-B CRISPR-associated protein Cas5b [Clostridium polynesiense]|uniref:type I-B CRISPR-associated protein Cas5b n=1 Tax=Clostridium polynesiense TaxID=1325933 RepID=UPI00058D9FAC|nr:type I-B CRISPR-associated protein Cas5b [Clostridium polynesiense]